MRFAGDVYNCTWGRWINSFAGSRLWYCGAFATVHVYVFSSKEKNELINFWRSALHSTKLRATFSTTLNLQCIKAGATQCKQVFPSPGFQVADAETMKRSDPFSACKWPQFTQLLLLRFPRNLPSPVVHNEEAKNSSFSLLILFQQGTTVRLHSRTCSLITMKLCPKSNEHKSFNNSSFVYKSAWKRKTLDQTCFFGLLLQ